MKISQLLAVVILAWATGSDSQTNQSRKALLKEYERLVANEKSKEAGAVAERLVAYDAKRSGVGSLPHCQSRMKLADAIMSTDGDRARKLCDAAATDLIRLKEYGELAKLYYIRASIEYPDHPSEEAKFYRLGLDAVAKLAKPPIEIRASLNNDLGLNLMGAGQFAQANVLLLKAQRDFASLGKDGLESLATVLNNLGIVCHELGATEESMAFYSEADRIEGEAGVKVADRAATWINYGAALRATGRLAEARTYLLKAEKALRPGYEKVRQSGKEFGPELGDQIAKLFTELALLYSTLGSDGASEKNHRLSMTVRERTEGNRPYFVSIGRNNLATHLRRTGKAKEAVSMFLAATKAYREQFKGASALEAGVYNNLGLAYEDLEQPGNAEGAYRKAMEVHLECMPKGHQDYGIYARNLGLLFHGQGQNESAEALITECIDNWKRSLLPGHASLVEALHSRVLVRAALGKQELANQDLAEACTTASQAVWNLARMGAETDSLNYSATFGTLIQLVAERTASGALEAREAYQLHLNLRGTAMRALIASQFARRQQEKSAAIAMTVDKVKGARRAVLQANPDEAEGLQRALVIAESELLRTIKLPQVDKAVSVEQVCGQLQEGEVLLEVIRYGRNNAHYGGFVVSKSDVEWIGFGEAKSVDLAVVDFRSSVNAREERPAKGDDLYNVLIAKHPKVANSKKLFVVPDGSLHSLPLAALPQPDGRYLIESKTIHWLTSGRDVFANDLVGKGTTPVIFANPNFGSAAGVEALRGTSLESDAIKGRLGAKVVSGSKATEDAVVGVRSPLVLHIASHGVFADSSPHSGGRSANPILASHNPLMRSCLLLAGANDYAARRKKRLSDGWLSAWEVSAMHLDGTQLVVLSACKTGLGDLRETEGIVGLRSAFRSAGARSVVMSLDRVDDTSSAALMERFYESYRRHSNPTHALRQAQLKMLRNPKFAAPFHWSLFIVEGTP